jgi:long-chain acyl-CoA synthetase
VPHTLDYSLYPSLADLLDKNLARFAPRAAFKFMGATTTYAGVDAQSRALAAYLQGLGLARGDRVAIMLPNVPQYPVAVAAALRGGYVVVNINPLYTARELAHALADSGAKAVVILENFAATLQAVLDAREGGAHAGGSDGAPPPPRPHVLLASVGESLGWLKGGVVDLVVRHVRKLVPRFALPDCK